MAALATGLGCASCVLSAPGSVREAIDRMAMSTRIVQNELLRFLSTMEPEVTCISGHWGVGKTFAWNKYVHEAKGRKDIKLKRYSYVSLFGLNSLDDLKYAIFENTVTSSEIGEPTLKSLQTNTLAALEGVGRRFTWFIQQIPLVRSHVGGLGPAWFLTVSETIVCIDDLERRGKGLSIRDVMGLASHLKERKRCKILLILNDEALEADKSEFEMYYEKVVDTALRFAPTAQECVEIALDGDNPSNKILAECCVALGICNIRLIKKVERAIRRIESLLQTYDASVFEYAVRSLVLFGWSVYDPKRAPALDYLTARTAEKLYAPGKPVTQNEAAWNALLNDYGVSLFNQFDFELLDGVRSGFFDPDRIKPHAVELDQRIRHQKDEAMWSDAWRLYRDSFDDNLDEVIEAMTAVFEKTQHRMSGLDLSAIVSLFKELGRQQLAQDLIRKYVDGRDRLEALNLHYYAGGRVADPDVVLAFSAKSETLRDEHNLAKVLRSIGNSWTGQDIDYLSSVSIDEYYQLFKASRGRDLHLLLKNCLQFDTIINASAPMKEVSLRAKEALRRLGRDSAINAARVREYGISSIT
jgi:hypothetical protein